MFDFGRSYHQVMDGQSDGISTSDLANEVEATVVTLQSRLPNLDKAGAYAEAHKRLTAACDVFLKTINPAKYSGLYIDLPQAERDELAWERPGDDCRHDGLLRRIIDPNDSSKAVGCRCAMCDGRAMFKVPK